MKKLLITALSTLLLIAPTSYSVFAQSKKAKAKTTQQASEEKSLLWKVSGNGLEQPSYLFGTIHLICEKDFYFTPVMEKSFAEVEKVVMEMDMDDPSLQMNVAMGMMNPDGKKLSDYFDPKDYELFESYAKEKASEIPMEVLEMMRPAAVWTTMIMSYYNCESVKSYEVELVNKAKEQDKEILGLETAQQQLDALLSMPDNEVIESINDMVNGKGKEAMDKQFEDMIAAYRSQSLHKLLEIAGRETSMKMNTEVLLDKRNQDWIPKMKKMMGANATFFAVGAAHLPGEQGVINLLKKEGYTVEPVK